MARLDRHVGMHRVRNEYGNGYCGPAVISSLTGWTSDMGAEHIRRHGERTPKRGEIRGVYYDDMIASVRGLGLTVEILVPQLGHCPENIEPEECRIERPWPNTLGRFSADRFEDLRQRYRAIVVTVTDHYMLLCGSQIVDNQLRWPTPLRDVPQRRRRIKQLWGVC